MSSTKDIVKDDGWTLELRLWSAKRQIELFDNRVQELGLELGQEQAMHALSSALISIVHTIEMIVGAKGNA